jgi:hypothetical protein
MKLATFMGAVIALGWCAACGSSSVPTPAVTDAKSQIAAAEAVGAQNNPQAALHLKLAKDQTQAAESAIRDGDNDKARLLLDRARVDAELALVLTRQASAQAEAQQAILRVNQLQQQGTH